MKPLFHKSKYLRVIHFTKAKRSYIEYINDENQCLSFLVNPEHVFLAGGFRSVIVTDKSAQTINPLDFESKYPADDFKTAIESKIVRETFATIDKKGLDITTLLLLLNILIGLACVYFGLQATGVI